jgi:hypothetical protein
MKFFPRKVDFFAYLDKAVANATRTTGALLDLMQNFTDVERKVKLIHELEKEGDMITHDIMRELNKTFITPIDREDIHRLGATIDDIVDLVWGGVDKMVVYRIEKPTHDAIHLAEDLHTTSQVLMKAMRELRAKEYEHVKEHCIEINSLENRLDRTYRNALGELFEDFKDDPVMIIKWKDIYTHLEDSGDKCEDVANVLESVVLKHA